MIFEDISTNICKYKYSGNKYIKEEDREVTTFETNKGTISINKDGVVQNYIYFDTIDYLSLIHI